MQITLAIIRASIRVLAAGSGLVVILGSWWTYGPVGALIVVFIIRTALEDRTLRRELTGYEAYTQQTRYRLLPGLW